MAIKGRKLSRKHKLAIGEAVRKAHLRRKRQAAASTKRDSVKRRAAK